MSETLPSFPVDDVVLDAVEHALGGALDENMELVGADYSLHQLLDFFSGYDPEKVVVLEEDAETIFGRVTITEYVGGVLYHPHDIIRALIAEVRRLRCQ